MNAWEKYAHLTIELKIITDQLRQLEPELIKQRNDFANEQLKKMKLEEKDDQADIKGIPGEKRIGEEPVETEPVKGSGGEKTEAN